MMLQLPILANDRTLMLLTLKTKCKFISYKAALLQQKCSYYGLSVRDQQQRCHTFRFKYLHGQIEGGKRMILTPKAFDICLWLNTKVIKHFFLPTSLKLDHNKLQGLSISSIFCQEVWPEPYTQILDKHGTKTIAYSSGGSMK
jgi:hypothetical protein